MKYPIKNSGKILGKNIVLIIIAILLVGGSFAYAEYRNKQAENVYRAPEIVSTIDRSAQDRDNDEDGVRDWEEILLGSNPNDPKSKPLRATSSPSTTLIKDLTKKTGELAPIDVVSREFFARYMELRQMGLSGDKLNQQDLVQKTVGSLPSSQAKLYVMSEIKTKADSSVGAVKNYGNEMADVFKKYVVSTKNEGIIVKEALERNNPEILDELNPVLESYRNILNGFLKIEAPQSMGIMHLDLINSMNSVLFVIQSFKKAIADPLLGVQAVSQYLVVQEKLFTALQAIQSYIIYLGITYEPSEPAFFFVHPK